MFKSSVILVIIISLCMWGCSRKDYYNAMNQQNMTVQLQNQKQEVQLEYKREQKEIRRQEHKLLMTTLALKMIDGAAKTATPVDDILGPILFIVMEDKFATSEMLVAMIEGQNEIQIQPMQVIEAPAEGVDYMKAALPYAGYALGAFGVYQYGKSMTDLAATAGTQYMLSGENNKMNVDSFKSGSNNVVTAGGDSSISAGDTVEGNCQTGDCEGEGATDLPYDGACSDASGYYVDEAGYVWVGGASNTLSCNSWLACHGTDLGGNWAPGCEASIDPAEEQ